MHGQKQTPCGSAKEFSTVHVRTSENVTLFAFLKISSRFGWGPRSLLGPDASPMETRISIHMRVRTTLDGCTLHVLRTDPFQRGRGMMTVNLLTEVVALLTSTVTSGLAAPD